MKITKILTALGLILAVAMVMPKSAAARAVNRNTGYRSINTAIVTDTKSFEYRALNLGGVVNVDLIGVNTGGNSADQNTSGGNDVDSGDATASVTTDDVVNLSTVSVNQCGCDVCPCDSTTAANTCTGAKSINTAIVTRDRDVTYRQASIGGVVNISAVGVNSGANSADQNTGGCMECGGGNDVGSGDARVTVRHTSSVNDSLVTVVQ